MWQLRNQNYLIVEIKDIQCQIKLKIQRQNGNFVKATQIIILAQIVDMFHTMTMIFCRQIIALSAARKCETGKVIGRK